MTLSTTSPRAKQRWAVLAVAVFTLTLIVAATTTAVHDDGVFELDGNAITGGVPPEPINPESSTGGEDWDVVYALTSTATATAFVTDPVNGNDDILTGGGTKDINDLSSWAWKAGPQVKPQDKADIGHAYAAQYGDHLYFGADRYANSGDTVMGFWFFRQEVGKVGQGSGTFTGSHTARDQLGQGERGDILVVSDFRNGGKAPVIKVYEWVSSGGSASTHLDLIGGGDTPASCTQAPGEKQNDPPVPPVGDNDNFCATANQFVVTSPWPFTAKSNTDGVSGPGGADTKFGVAMFMEGGIDLGFFGFGETCFSSFLAETRASHSVTSTLSDFALGGFGDCDSDLTTTPQAHDGEDFEDIGSGGVSIGTEARLLVRDAADLQISGATNFGGTIDFYLCGPDEAALATCSEDDGVHVASVEVNGSGTYYSDDDGDEVILTSAGNYCWFGFYSGDAEVGVPEASDDSADECFTVNPVQPTLTTEAGADVTLTNPITDEAELSGTAKQPGNDGVGPGGTINATADSQANASGEITWTLYGPDSCVDSGLTITGSPAAVDGDDTYGPVSATPSAIGEYYFAADYDGDSPNTLDVSHNHDCQDGDQKVTVTGEAALSTAQDWLPNDTATLTGPTNLTGTLTFKLYDNGSCDVEGDVLYEETVPVADAESGSTFRTTNGDDPATTFLVKEADSGSYSWLVTYDDDTLADPDPTCETTDIDIED